MGDLSKKVAMQIAYELGYTWGSSALDHEAFYSAANSVIALVENSKNRKLQ